MFGEPVDGRGLERLFPTPAQLRAPASNGRGWDPARAEAIRSLARRVESDRTDESVAALDVPAATPRSTSAMRALGEPDAFPAAIWSCAGRGDVAAVARVRRHAPLAGRPWTRTKRSEEWKCAVW